MQEFDPRRPTLRLAPRLFTAVAGLAALALGWKLTAGDAPSTVVAAHAPLDAAAMVALQHVAFAQAEAQPGFDRPETVSVKVRPGETLQGAVQRSGVGADEANQVVSTLQSAMDTVNIKAGMAFEAAPEATIVSPWHGTVAYAGPFRGYGVILIVDSGDGYHWFVTGFGRLDVAPGQPVRAGEPVGQAPVAGAARPVVYVELRRNGQPVDPAPWVALPNGKVGG